MPSVSIVIPTLNEAEHLAELLPQLRRQSLAPLEVVVADHDSSDDSARVAAELGARLAPGGRPAQARNQGAGLCRGEWIFFLDADTRLTDQGFLQRALEELEDRGLSAAVTDVVPYYRPCDKGHGRPVLRAWDRMLMRTQNQGQRTFLRLGFPVGTAQFMAVRRIAFESLGGFRSQVEPFEDSELLLRVHRALPPPPGAASSVGVLAPQTRVLVSMRRFDVKGRVIFPCLLSLRSCFLRYILKREFPLPSYWDVNRKGLYAKGNTPRRGA